jgi:hypothetical protein
MGTKKTLILLMLAVMVLPGVSASQEVPAWETSCINSTHLLKTISLMNATDGSYLIDANSTVMCSYGCDTRRNVCMRWPGDSIPGEYYMLFEGTALGLFLFMIYRFDTSKGDMRTYDVLIPVMAIMLFLILSLQGNSVIDMSTGEWVPVTMVVYFDYGFALLSIALFFYNMFKYAGAVAEEGGKL